MTKALSAIAATPVVAILISGPREWSPRPCGPGTYPQAEAAENDAEYRRAIADMLAELQDAHTGVVVPGPFSGRHYFGTARAIGGFIVVDLVDSGRALLVGRRTAGSSGNPVRSRLPGGRDPLLHRRLPPRGRNPHRGRGPCPPRPGGLYGRGSSFRT